jgi:hypothetical protein
MARRAGSRFARITTLAGASVLVAATLAATASVSSADPPSQQPSGTCQLGADGKVKHVIYI